MPNPSGGRDLIGQDRVVRPQLISSNFLPIHHVNQPSPSLNSAEHVLSNGSTSRTSLLLLSASVDRDTEFEIEALQRGDHGLTLFPGSRARHLCRRLRILADSKHIRKGLASKPVPSGHGQRYRRFLRSLRQGTIIHLHTSPFSPTSSPVFYPCRHIYKTDPDTTGDRLEDSRERGAIRKKSYTDLCRA